VPLVHVVDEFGHASRIKQGLPTIGPTRMTAENIKHHAQMFGEASINDALFHSAEQDILQRAEIYLRQVLKAME
jgi:hypothetical protein